ncbi:sodium-coupled neutral amino acid transporter 9 [Silurus asotus]|uniref:Neutral amino acid transporter 9 n=1 Tax=Silurus asotus TaxID=30991 RepID=A0AAD5FFZ2_SILAS|nr:sodium-coupled neutral amino acid transporter 9 [Silurus asotus]
MEDDGKPLLGSIQAAEEDYYSDQVDFLDSRQRRPFHVEPRNIVEDSAQEQRVSAEASVLNSRVHYYGRLTASSDRLLLCYLEYNDGNVHSEHAVGNKAGVCEILKAPPDHVIPSPEELYVYSPLGTAFKVQAGDGSVKNPSIVTIFAIWNTMMGTSILSMPWGIKQSGFTLGIIILILMGLITLYCCYRVLKSTKSIPYIDTSDWEFPDVCKYYFGRMGQWSSLFFSMISLIGAMVVYWVLMSNFLFNTGKFIYDYVHNVNMSDSEFGTNGTERVLCPYPDVDPDINKSLSQHYVSGNSSDTALFDHWWNKTNTIPLYLILLLFPLLCFRSASFFARFTFLGTLSVIYLLVLVTLKAFRLGFHLEFHWFESSNFFVPEFRVLCPQLTGVLTLAFFIHNCIITLMKSNKNQENNVRDLSLAYLLVGLTYLYVGVLVFVSFPSPPLSKDCIEPNFLDNFPSSDVLVFVARAFLLFQMTTVYPLLGYLVRVQIMGHFFGNPYPRYSGATCGLALVFVFPSAVHLMALRRSGELRWLSACFHIFLIILGLANLLAQFFL